MSYTLLKFKGRRKSTAKSCYEIFCMIPAHAVYVHVVAVQISLIKGRSISLQVRKSMKSWILDSAMWFLDPRFQ